MPALQKIVGWISNMVTWFQNLSPTTQKVIVVIASLAAAIGPVLTVGGKLLAMLPLIKAAFTAMTGPIGLVISALVALGAAFVSARQQQAEFARQQAEQAKQARQEHRIRPTTIPTTSIRARYIVMTTCLPRSVPLPSSG